MKYLDIGGIPHKIDDNGSLWRLIKIRDHIKEHDSYIALKARHKRVYEQDLIRYKEKLARYKAKPWWRRTLDGVPKLPTLECSYWPFGECWLEQWEKVTDEIQTN